jgi:hypothetical protein
MHRQAEYFPLVAAHQFRKGLGVAFASLQDDRGFIRDLTGSWHPFLQYRTSGRGELCSWGWGAGAGGRGCDELDAGLWYFVRNGG